ncbi:MAG: hypothetical protein AMXMBFR7_15230 [Planctomycetota bacterium]
MRHAQLGAGVARKVGDDILHGGDGAAFGGLQRFKRLHRDLAAAYETESNGGDGHERILLGATVPIGIEPKGLESKRVRPQLA